MTVPLPTRLLIATTNPGKLDEIRGILGALPVTLVTLADHPPVPEPEETGSTFAENARLKARYYAGATGELTVAEDSGLEIDALDGEPGVHSARFNGESYAEKFATIQEMFAERGTDMSTARFVCALTLTRTHGIVWETTVSSKAACGGRHAGTAVSATTQSSTTRHMAARWRRSPPKRRRP